MVDWNAGKVYTNDIIGVYEEGVITLDTEEYWGVMEFLPSYGAFLGIYLAYTDENGNFVPVTFSKK